MALFTDDFNRANSTNLGGNWTEAAGDWQITSNQLVGPTGTGTLRCVQTTTTAHAAVADVRATIKRVSGASFDAGPCVRRAAAADTCYYLDVVAGASSHNVYRRVTGADTLVGSVAFTSANGDTYGLQAVGTGPAVQLAVYQNGTLVGVLFDTNAARLTAAGQTGVIHWSDSPVFDDFSADAATAVPAIRFLGSTFVTTAAATYTTGSLTPAAGTLPFMLGPTTTQVATDWAASDSLGGAWTKIDAARAQKATNADKIDLFVRGATVAGSAMTFTHSHASGTTTGGGALVFELWGVSKTGSAAVRGVGVQNNIATVTAPAPVLPAAALSTNPTLWVAFNSTATTLTVPAGWSSLNFSTYSTPTTGLTVAGRNFGFTGTTITGGSNSATAYCSQGVEFDAGGAAAQTPGPPFPGLPGAVAAM